MPTADTSRAALQALAGVLEDASSGLSSADFAVTINVTAAGAVLDGAASYQPNSIQRLTLTPTGALRVQPEPVESAWTLEDHQWTVSPWTGDAWSQ